MFRATTSRPISRGLANVVFSRTGYGLVMRKATLASHFHTFEVKRPQVAFQELRPVVIPKLRYATKPRVPKVDEKDTANEKRIAEEELGSNPEGVSTTSSVRHVFESGQAPVEEDNEVLGGLKQDFNTIKDSFALSGVPRESYYLGAAGTLPYLATSLATVYLSYGINHAPATGSTLFFPVETAHYYLAALEPIQIGYGAVILSFLGAIHWGLEYAGYGGHQRYQRYVIGCAMPAIAWPTMLMPFEYALITQFAAFTGLYFADARQGVRGFAPSWYPTYRFVLTFIVGISIVASLIGRGQIEYEGSGHPTRADKMRELSEMQPEALREEEIFKEEKRNAAAAAAAAGDKKNDKIKDDNNKKKDENKGVESKGEDDGRKTEQGEKDSTEKK